MSTPLFQGIVVVAFLLSCCCCSFFINLPVDNMAASQSDQSVSAFDVLTPSSSAAGAPDEISYNGQVWMKFDHPQNRKKGTKVSLVWTLGQSYIAVDDPSKRAWRCTSCGSRDVLILLSGDNPSNAGKHLAVKHGINVTEKTATTVASRRGSLRHGSIVNSMDISAFRRHLLQWILTRQQSFIEEDDTHFQGMLLALNQSVQANLVDSGNTIKNWLQEEFVKAASCIKEILSTAQSRIHINMDLWSSPNGYALCGIVAHLIDADLNNRQCLLGLKRMLAGHSGEEMAEVMIPVLREYGVLDNLGVVISDKCQYQRQCRKSNFARYSATWNRP